MKIVKTLIMSSCIAFAGCGMTDPWKEWEDNGNLDGRLLPSELKETLCAADWWKMTYSGYDFYYSFNADGNVQSSSSMFKDAIEGTYYFDWDEAKSVELVVAGGGHLQYLSSDLSDDTFVVTGFSQDKITGSLGNSGKEIEMTSMSSADMEKIDADKWKVRNILLGSAGWKLSYEGYDFYFEFGDEGKVRCNSNMLQAAAETSYSFSGSAESPVLTIDGGGHLAFLPEGQNEEVFDVVSADASKVTLKGEKSGETMEMTPVDASAIAAVEEAKGPVFKIIEAGLYNGVIRSSDDKFLAHYAIDRSSGSSVRFDILVDRVLTHKTVAISIDKSAKVTLDEAVSISGQSITGISFNTDAKTAAVDGASGLKITSQSDIVDWFINDFKTYIIRYGENRGDMCDELKTEFAAAAAKSWDKLEISDRDRRPFMVTPNNFDDSKYYVAFFGSDQNKPADIVTDEMDLIIFPKAGNPEGNMIMGGDSKNIDIVKGLLPKILDAFFHKDGMYVILEGEKNADNSQLYLISPTTSAWFKADRDM